MQYGQIEIASFLITSKANPDIKNKVTDKTRCSISIRSVWIAHGRLFEQYESMPLIIAAMGGVIEIVSLLIAHKANLDSQNKVNYTTPCTFILSFGKLDLVLLCLQDNRSPLHCTVVNGHAEIASLLIAHRANSDLIDNVQAVLISFQSSWKSISPSYASLFWNVSLFISLTVLKYPNAICREEGTGRCSFAPSCWKMNFWYCWF